jgi:hypothetical protein
MRVGDSDANVKIRVRELMERKPIAGHRNWDEPGAEPVRAALEHVLGQQRPKHYVEPWKIGHIDCANAVYGDVVKLVQENTPALEKVAKARGYYTHAQAPSSPQSDPESFYVPKAHSYAREPQGTWEKGKYADTPEAPPDHMRAVDAVRSRYMDLPDPPLLRNGQVDFDKLTEMTGHKPYTGPGKSHLARSITKPGVRR